MSEQYQSNPVSDAGSVNEKVDQIKDTVREQGEQARDWVDDRIETLKALEAGKVDWVKIVQTVTLVGILLTNRKALKLSKHVIKQNDKNIVRTANFIKELKDAGRTFEFFPGVGVWVE